MAKKSAGRPKAGREIAQNYFAEFGIAKIGGDISVNQTPGQLAARTQRIIEVWWRVLDHFRLGFRRRTAERGQQCGFGDGADDAVNRQTARLLEAAHGAARHRPGNTIHRQLQAQNLIERLLHPANVIGTVAIDLALRRFIRFELVEVERLELKIEKVRHGCLRQD